jgi:hypothetical protein
MAYEVADIEQELAERKQNEVQLIDGKSAMVPTVA